MCCHGSQGRLQNKVHSTRGKLIDEGGVVLRAVLPAERVQEAVKGARVECHSLKRFRPLFQAFSKFRAWQGHVVVSFSAVLYYSRLVAVSYGIHD